MKKNLKLVILLEYENLKKKLEKGTLQIGLKKILRLRKLKKCVVDLFY